MSTTKVKININEGTIELEGSEEFVKSYLDEFKVLLKAPPTLNTGAAHPPVPPPEVSKKSSKVPKEAKKVQGKKVTANKKSPPKLTPERFEIHGSDDVPSLQAFFDEKKPGKANGKIIAVIGYYITDLLGSTTFTEGQIEYAYRMLNLKRPAHLRQIIINQKNQNDYFEQDEEGTVWKLTRTGEIYVSDKLPEQA